MHEGRQKHLSPVNKSYIIISSGSKLFFRGPNNFCTFWSIYAPSTAGLNKQQSIILAPSKSNLCALLMAFSSLSGWLWLPLVSFLDPLLHSVDTFENSLFFKHTLHFTFWSSWLVVIMNFVSLLTNWPRISSEEIIPVQNYDKI